MSGKVTPRSVSDALHAWWLALHPRVRGEMRFPCEESIEETAKSIGARVTNKESLDIAATFFDWDVITGYLEQRQAEEDQTPDVDQRM